MIKCISFFYDAFFDNMQSIIATERENTAKETRRILMGYCAYKPDEIKTNKTWGFKRAAAMSVDEKLTYRVPTPIRVSKSTVFSPPPPWLTVLPMNYSDACAQII